MEKRTQKESCKPKRRKMICEMLPAPKDEKCINLDDLNEAVKEEPNYHRIMKKCPLWTKSGPNTTQVTTT